MAVFSVTPTESTFSVEVGEVTSLAVDSANAAAASAAAALASELAAAADAALANAALDLTRVDLYGEPLDKDAALILGFAPVPYLGRDDAGIGGNPVQIMAAEETALGLTLTRRDFSSIIDFTRASSATFVGDNGLIQTAGNNVPRIDHDSLTRETKGLLVEGQRANLLPRSAEFDNVIWEKGGVTVGVDVTTSPDGGPDADKLVEDATTGFHRTAQVVSLTAATHSLSFFAKAQERNWVFGGDISEGRIAYFDLANGVVGFTAGGAVGSIVRYASNWYRCTVVFTTPAPSNNFIGVGLTIGDATQSYTGSVGNGAFFWGAQLEVGASPTSYIPTVASQVTRSACNARITGAKFSEWFNATAGTFVVEAVAPSTVSAPVLVGYNAASTASLFVNGANASTWNGAVQVTQVGGDLESNVFFKAALAYSLTGRSVTSNGGVPTSDASLIGAADVLALGRPGFSNDQFLNGCIRSVRFWPYRFSNADLQSITV